MIKEKVRTVRSRLQETQDALNFEFMRAKEIPKVPIQISEVKKDSSPDKKVHKRKGSIAEEEPQSIFRRRKRSLLESQNLRKSNNTAQTQSIIKEKSIVPSDSYVKNIGFGTSNVSPQLKDKPRMKAKMNSTILKESNFYDVAPSDESFRKKRTKPSTSKKRSAKDISLIKNSVTLRSQLQERYRNQNTMSHTPNPKKAKKQYDSFDIKKKRSKTPEPKPISALLEKSKIQFITAPLHEKVYTLVLDLDETLIHFKNDKGKAKFLIRPHTYKFLKNMYKYFEIIIFTAAQQEYADWIINKIDTKVYYSYYNGNY